MKKFLIPLVCGLLGLSACQVEDTYYITNCQDIVTIVGGELTNGAVVFNVVQKASDNLPAFVEGERYLITFDVLNRQLDILLKDVLPGLVTPATQTEEEITEVQDPVILAFSILGPKYLDLGLSFYKSKKSDFAHTFSLKYSYDSTLKVLNLYLIHQGNHENPVEMDQKELETGSVFLCIPIEDWPNLRKIILHADVVSTNSEGVRSIIKREYAGGEE